MQDDIARFLLQINAVKFAPDKPITFKSGIVSPVYVDNRTIPYHPQGWHTVIAGFQTIIQSKNISFDVIAGIETAGIPHSAALGYAIQKPSIFVRKQAKDHGLKSRVEGGEVSGKRVLLIEDMITTGGSSLSGVEALHEAGAIVEHVLAIISYGFAEAQQAFAQAQVQLHTLTNFQTILAQGHFSPEDKTIIERWLADPHHWTTQS